MHKAMAIGGLLLAATEAHAAERVTLRNGFTIDCARHQVSGVTERLFFSQAPDAGYMDVPVAEIEGIEVVPDQPAAKFATQDVIAGASTGVVAATGNPTASELRTLLERSGGVHRIDTELLASVVHAESAGRVRAVSRAGARGLMQLMPGTAAALGVADAFAPEQNVEGGTRYLDQLLTRYHDDLALALAAYNAGPAAVDRYHGVPPFRETRLYVARIIHEYNQRKTALLAAVGK